MKFIHRSRLVIFPFIAASILHSLLGLIPQCMASPGDEVPSAEVSWSPGDDAVLRFLSDLPDAGRIDWFGIYDEDKAYTGPSRKMGWSMYSIVLDKKANHVTYSTEDFLSGSYFGKPNEHRQTLRIVFQAVPPFAPISAVEEFKEWRDGKLEHESTKIRKYSNGFVEIQHIEAGETRTETIPAGKYSLQDSCLQELLPYAGITGKAVVVSNKDAQPGNEYDHEVAKIESTDSGWTIEITEPDGTFIAKAGVDRAGVVQYWQLPFGCTCQREEELVAKSGLGGYQFAESTDFQLRGQDPTAGFIKSMTVSVTGNWTDLITASDFQDVSYDSALDQTVIDLHPLTRAQVPESPGDRDRYLIDTPGIPDTVSEIGRAITSHAATDTERLHAIFSWMFRRIRYQHNFDPPSCVEVVKELKGDCSEFASLMVLLCRSVGIPAREITGLACHENGSMGLHAWTEVLVDGNWMSVDPTWGELQPAHIRLTFEKRQNAAASTLYEQLVSERPVFSVLHLETDHASWQSLYSDLSSQWPEEPLWLYQLSASLQNDATRAKALLEKSVEIDPEFPHAWRTLAYQHRVFDDEHAAIRCLERARELNPIDESLTIEVATSYSDIGERQKALAVLSKAIEDSPGSAQLLIHRGSIFLSIGDASGAIEDFRAVCRQQPTDVDSWKLLINALREANRYSEAHAATNEAIDLFPLDATLHHVNGLIWLSEERWIEAAAAFRLASERCPEEFGYVSDVDPELHLTAAELYVKNEDYSEAAESFDSVIRLSDRDSRLQTNRLLCFIAEHPELSATYLDEFIRVAETYSLPDELNSVAATASFSPNKSLPWDRLQSGVQRTIYIWPDNPTYLATLGAIEFRMGNHASAKIHLLKSLELSGFDISLLTEETRRTPQLNEGTGKNSTETAYDHQIDIVDQHYVLGFLAMTLDCLGDPSAAARARHYFEHSRSDDSSAHWRKQLSRKLLNEEVHRWSSKPSTVTP